MVLSTPRHPPQPITILSSPRGGNGFTLNRETPAERNDDSQLIITPALTDLGASTNPPVPAVVQHAIPLTPVVQPTKITPARAQQCFLSHHQPQSAVTAEFVPRQRSTSRTTSVKIMDRDNPPPPIFPTTDNDQLISDTDIMRSYAIDTLFDSAYYTGDTEEIETAETLRAPDRD